MSKSNIRKIFQFSLLGEFGSNKLKFGNFSQVSEPLILLMPISVPKLFTLNRIQDSTHINKLTRTHFTLILQELIALHATFFAHIC